MSAGLTALGLVCDCRCCQVIKTTTTTKSTFYCPSLSAIFMFPCTARRAVRYIRGSRCINISLLLLGPYPCSSSRVIICLQITVTAVHQTYTTIAPSQRVYFSTPGWGSLVKTKISPRMRRVSNGAIRPMLFRENNLRVTGAEMIM